MTSNKDQEATNLQPHGTTGGVRRDTEVTWGTRTPIETERRRNCGEGREETNSLDMSTHNPKVDDVKATEARLREGAVAKALLEIMTEAAVIRIN